jgi:hypothetical protein
MIGIDIHLLKLSEFLQNLEVARAGKVFILEHNGTLIANSGSAQPFKVVKDEIQRLQGDRQSRPAGASDRSTAPATLPRVQHPSRRTTTVGAARRTALRPRDKLAR